ALIPVSSDILQYALTLENLENAFYSMGLAKFAQSDFENAGYPDWVRNRIVQIGGHEAQHVALLSGALGSAATQPCTYNFDAAMADVNAFIGYATLIENVGVSAYLGAASSITEPAYVTVAGSILTTEARHQGWLSSSVSKNQPWSGPEDTPLDFDEVYTIAAEFISSCPSTNPTLPVQAFPALTIGTDGTITTTASTANTYVQLVSGLDSNVFPVVNGKVQGLPQPQGISYAVLTTSSTNSGVSDSNIVAGPMILNNPFTSKVPNPAPNF
ncbi:ferritin-like domain-domain-containing protein, partial [Kockovaella imperatae]